MKDGLQMAFAVVALAVIGVACGWAGLIVVPGIIAAVVAHDRYRASRLEALRLESVNARRDYDAAVAELENARADLARARDERRRVRDALRAGGWMVADETVALN